MLHEYTDEELFAVFTPKRGGPICGNCIVRNAVCIHEIEPKSARPTTWRQPENRIPLCAYCHSWATEIAAPGVAAKTFRKNRTKALRFCGRTIKDVRRLAWAA